MKSFIVFFLLCFCMGMSQVSAQIIWRQLPQIFIDSDCIFEGQVIRSDAYFSPNEDFIYTSHTVEISKVFKGDVICGTIEIITEGGELGGKSLDITHNLTFRMGEIGIFCAKIAPYDTSAIDFYPETVSGHYYI